MSTATLTKPAAKGGSFLLESPQPGDVFTPADLADDQKLMGQTAEEFVVKEVLPLVKDLENKKPGLMPALVKKAGEVGLMGGGVPEEYGGAGLDKIATTVLTEKLSIYGGFAVTHGAHAGIGTLPIVYFGTEAQKKKYLPKLATGEWIGAYCLSEPQAGSDAQNSLTRAELNNEGTHYILNGQKMWITNGGFADVYIVFAKVDGEKFTAFIVERTFPGFKPGNEEHKMGIHGSSTTPIFLENCKVPKENLLHEIGRGHIVAFNILNAGRFTLGASCVGGSKHVLMTASKYTKERKAFGKQIGDFGLMKEKLAEMAIQIFAVESMVYRSAGNIEAMMSAAMKLADEILAGPSFEETTEGVLAEETRVVANAKKMFLQAAGGAVQKFRDKLADEQELVAALANVVMEVYAMESCLLRAQKAATSKSEAAVKTMIDAARVFI